EQLGLGDQGARDGQALALAAAEVVGALAESSARDAGKLQGGGGALAAYGARAAALDHQRLLHNFGGGESRVEAGGGLLEDELDIQPPLRRGGKAFEEDLAAAWGFELRQATGERTLAGARGADDGQGAAPVQAEADSGEGGRGGQGRREPAAAYIGFRQIADAQQRVSGHELLPGSGRRRAAPGAGRRWRPGCRAGG